MKHKRKNKTNKVKIRAAWIVAAAALCLAGCGKAGAVSGENASDVERETRTEADGTNGAGAAKAGEAQTDQEPVELTILAAASLTDVCGEIKERYEAAHEGVNLTFSYGGSGALQTQIEEGALADVFLSAAEKQMDALEEEGLMDSDSIQKLLENKVVLIVPKDSTLSLTDFSDVTGEEVTLIGLGDPASVPVGQYAEEIFSSLGILDEVKAKANYGTDVRNVLAWVESGAVDCGVVYATDARTTEDVTIVSCAPEDSCTPVIYPAGIVKSSAHPEEAQRFLEYLRSPEAEELFESYGFSMAGAE